MATLRDFLVRSTPGAEPYLLDDFEVVRAVAARLDEGIPLVFDFPPRAAALAGVTRRDSTPATEQGETAAFVREDSDAAAQAAEHPDAGAELD